MPAKPISINLIGQEELAHTPQGRIVAWALTYGRYIMIGTEIVVLLAFISRFSLDRKLTDLKDEISQKQAILQANSQFETEVRRVQDSIIKIKTLLSDQSKPVDALKLVGSLLPPSVYLKTIDINRDKLSAEAVASTTDRFGQFLNNLQATKQLANVDIGDIKKNPLVGISFKFSAVLSQPPKSK